MANRYELAHFDIGRLHGGSFHFLSWQDKGDFRHGRTYVVGRLWGIIEDDAEKMRTLRLLAARYSDYSVTPQMTDKEIAGGFKRLLMVEITIEHLTGKEAIELVNR